MPILAILWARRLFLLTAVAGCLLGALTVMATSPPRYLATARVMMNYVKPDPVTGGYVSSENVEAYVLSQMQLVQDFQVAGPAAQALGWFEDPELQAEYAADALNVTLDFPTWAARSLLLKTSARPVEDSNLLEIGFRGRDPEEAKRVVQAVRQAFVDVNVNRRSASARSQADTLMTKAELLRRQVAAMEDAKAAFERQVGVSLQGGREDLDSTKLRALVSDAPTTYMPGWQRPSSASMALSQLDQQVASAERALGPNHPGLQKLRRDRELLRSQVQAERTGAQSTTDLITATETAKQAFIETQKDKVLSQRDVVLRLRLQQDEIDRQSKALKETLEAVANLRQTATATSGGLILWGEPKARDNPVFPNPWLMIGGGAGMGLLLGVMLALLAELGDRRVRSTRDLELATAMPVLGVVPSIPPAPIPVGTGRRGVLTWFRRRRALAA